MAVDERAFRVLQQRAEQARAARDRAAGQMDAAMARLRDEFGCESLKQAKAMLKKLERDAVAAEGAYAIAEKEFNDAWGEYEAG